MLLRVRTPAEYVPVQRVVQRVRRHELLLRGQGVLLCRRTPDRGDGALIRPHTQHAVNVDICTWAGHREAPFFTVGLSAGGLTTSSSGLGALGWRTGRQGWRRRKAGRWQAWRRHARRWGALPRVVSPLAHFRRAEGHHQDGAPACPAPPLPLSRRLGSRLSTSVRVGRGSPLVGPTGIARDSRGR